MNGLMDFWMNDGQAAVPFIDPKIRHPIIQC
jgi:hypothetical protein